MSRINKNWNADYPEVPVDKYGNWLTYPDYRCVDWVRVTPWFDTLRVDSMETGRSAKRIIVVDSFGIKYPMFVATLVNAIKDSSVVITGGKIKARWTVCKKGQNYGIEPVKTA